MKIQVKKKYMATKMVWPAQNLHDSSLHEYKFTKNGKYEKMGFLRKWGISRLENSTKR